MNRFFITITLIFVSGFCFAQQDLPSIVGRLPSPDSQAMYQIQVGAFLLARNAVDISNRLRGSGFDTAFENFRELTRVIIPGIPANAVIAHLERLKRLGIDQVIIREDTGGNTIAEKWAIDDPESKFSSFEFNPDNRYIVLERQGGQQPLVHFGEYIMPRPDYIDMIDFGTLRIRSRDGDDIDFSFAPADEPGAYTSYEAVKEKPMPRTPETDTFARAWKVIDSTRKQDIGTIVLFSINGTYLVSKSDDTSFISHWRWRDEKREEFEYSHDNWRSYGRATIDTLRQGLLKFLSLGHSSEIEGFSSGSRESSWELVPIRNF